MRFFAGEVGRVSQKVTVIDELPKTYTSLILYFLCVYVCVCVSVSECV